MMLCFKKWLDYLKTAVSEMMEQLMFFSLRSFAKECPLKEGGFSVMIT
jgi:hypothetical protein